MRPRRGRCYRVRNQRPGSVGLLVLSNDASHRTSGEASGVVVRVDPQEPPGVELPGRGHASICRFVRVSQADLEEALFEPEPHELGAVERRLADLLLLPELSGPVPTRAGSPDGDYPRWGRTYYAEPPLSGQVKRWLVVSHDWFNAESGVALCVRTTSNTDLHGHELPYIEAGLALAVCPDLMTKRHDRFDLASEGDLEQTSFDEMRRVAIGLANFLSLLRQAGLLR